MRDITAKDLLQHSFVINIDEERLKWFKKVFKFHGLEPLPRKFPGVTLWYNSPQYNCYLAHKNAILKAKKLKWPYVCIFEDDTYPCNGAMNEIDKYLKLLPEECQVLSLGTIMAWGGKNYDDNFCNSFQSYGAHAYVVFKDAYDKYVELLDKFPEGDGALYAPKNDIFPKDAFFIPKKNLFIQYTKSKAMNNVGGYIWIDSRKCRAYNGKVFVPYDKSMSEEVAVKLGFPKASEIE